LIEKEKHLNMDVQKRGSAFAKCTVCESLKDFISKVGKTNPCVKSMKLNLRNITFTNNLVDVYITLGELNLCNS